MGLISVFMMVFLTTITGSIVFTLWKLISVVLERCGKLKVIKSLLIVTIWFYLIPVVFSYFAYRTGLFGRTKTGTLFNSTPVFMAILQMGAIFWISGFILEVLKYMSGQAKIHTVIRNSCLAHVAIQETAVMVKKELNIRRDIPVYECLGQDVPVIVGLLHCRILLPEKEYGKIELEMILEHELLHYRHKDLILKKLCAWIVRIQWFNPMTRLLFAEIDTWGDAMCDLEICHGEKRQRGIKEYFTVVIENSRKAKELSDRPMEMRLSGAEKLYRRIERMRKYKREKDFKRWMVVILTLCFIMASSVTSLAAGKGVETVYKKAYAATAVQEAEALSDEDEELEEYTWTPDGSETITQFTENPFARGLNYYEWEIPAGEIYETGMFYATSGDTIDITINTSPKGSEVGAGLHQPNGVMRGVTSTSPYSHTFTVSQTGIHRIYAENKENFTVTVGLTVSR